MSYFDGQNFGNSKEWCHQHSGKPVRKVKLCPCGLNKGCPVCGYGEATMPHKCKSIRIQ